MLRIFSLIAILLAAVPAHANDLPKVADCDEPEYSLDQYEDDKELMLELAVKAYKECLLHVVHSHQQSDSGNESEIAKASKALKAADIGLQAVFAQPTNSDENQRGGIAVVPCGSEWINLHDNNPDLLGVYIRQLPDNKDDQAQYVGKHPALVVFVFANNRAHQLSFTPSGQVSSGFWWDVPPGDRIYNDMSSELKLGTICQSSDTFDFSRTE